MNTVMGFGKIAGQIAPFSAIYIKMTGKNLRNRSR
jgi:hypothetical protein